MKLWRQRSGCRRTVTLIRESSHTEPARHLLSAAVYGIDASLIEVEVDVAPIKTEQDHFTTVGLPDATARESRERIRSALKNSGYDIPPTTTTIDLALADIRDCHRRRSKSH